MEGHLIKKVIEIKASLDKVWSVFTNPEITRKIGGYYDTDWKSGSSFGFTDTNGNRLTNGILLEFEPNQLIKHNLFESNSDTVAAIITYEFQKKNDYTLLIGTEKLSQSLNIAAFNEASEGWESALNLVKQIAEELT